MLLLPLASNQGSKLLCPLMAHSSNVYSHQNGTATKSRHTRWVVVSQGMEMVSLVIMQISVASSRSSLESSNESRIEAIGRVIETM